MLTEKKNTFHVTHPSLLLLRSALIAAERDAPPSPRPDANEQLALKLIETMRNQHRTQLPILISGDVPSLYGYRTSYKEMASVHA